MNIENKDNIDFFMIINTYEHVIQIMKLGLFSKGGYYSIVGDKFTISSAPVFDNNKLILELKLKVWRSIINS